MPLQHLAPSQYPPVDLSREPRSHGWWESTWDLLRGLDVREWSAGEPAGACWGACEAAGPLPRQALPSAT